MRPPSITNEAVIQAGQAIQAEGRNVTAFGLRQKIGGGNPNRLKQIWDEYATNQANAADSEPTAPVELPPDVAEKIAQVGQTVVDCLNGLVSQLIASASEQADRRIVEVMQAAEAVQAQATQELIAATDSVNEADARAQELQDQLEAEKANHQAALTAVTERAAAAEAKAQALQTDLDRVREEGEKAKEEGRGLASRLSAAEATVTELRNSLEMTGKALSKAEDRAGELRKTVDGMSQEAKEMQERVITAIEEAAVLRGRLQGQETAVPDQPPVPQGVDTDPVKAALKPKRKKS
ncbi:MAG: DNA-binding protein [Candidatus Accumulibacter sp.]|nr:DNA-binding protein [Accumulibacter sp.]